ncbi:2Fe-2S iron-sulfur cluster-binding protein [Zavarzinia aquatilis]|uniref:Oxidoreductase n=1 Tax=Zavarzinia aquatilis TaxID=2211142 RepID=A0A317DYG7_9PROT|nr:2Fe-2S iron-sulfur cluster-binding protein [Zavarzinia aquatilis]PWR19501.1 oxidoreductase [Zavarzinia aquatilis]
MGEGYTIAVAGTSRTFPCAADDTLLGAALRAGIGIAYECASGGCGSCRVDLCDGAVDLAYPASPGLKPRDFERGRRLACMSRPTRDCAIRFREEAAAIPVTPPRRRVARLEARRPVTRDIDEFDFAFGQEAPFLAGQFALLQLPGLPSARAYSMANVPGGRHWQFMIRRVPGGDATRILFDLRPGDLVEIDGPYSTAHFRADSPRDTVCVAGGSGLAPVLSVARAALADTGRARCRVHFFYGARTLADMVTPEALGLADERVTFHPVLSEPDGQGWPGETGYVHEALDRLLPGEWADHDFYLAGPPPMVEAVRRLLLLDRGVPADRVYYDRFF